MVAPSDENIDAADTDHRVCRVLRQEETGTFALYARLRQPEILNL
jgi:hypothetical protein